VIAIAADSVEDTARLQAKLPGITLLTDLDLSASTAWHLHEPGAEAPSPGTFVIRRDGVVGWRRLEDSRGDWPTFAELTAALNGG
jgi:peroxiredoxin